MTTNPHISQTLTEQAIAAYAYHLWESEGRIEGRDQDYWLQAEAHLRAHQELGADSAKDTDEKPVKEPGSTDVSNFNPNRPSKPSKKRRSRPIRQPAFA